MKEIIPINTTADGCAYAIKASYFKNFAISTATKGGDTSPVPLSKSLCVGILGHYSENSMIGGRVIDTSGLAPSIMAGTHGYGFGCILEYEDSPTFEPDAR